MIFFLILSVLLFAGFHYGLYKLFEAAGEKGWKALVPVYRIKSMIEITGRPKWYFPLFITQAAFVLSLMAAGENFYPWWLYVLFYLVCVYNVFLFVALCLDISKSFGRTGFWQNAATVLFTGFFFTWLARQKDLKYLGKGRTFPKVKKKPLREWADAIAFAVFAATVIRWATFEAFTIPTGSMEKSLLVGDYLFVSKMHYGARTPMTLLQVPLTHRYWWMTANEQGKEGVESYLDWINLPYGRLPGFTKVKNGDVVVFNYPRDLDAPVDLRTNYIKRCIGIPGDTFEIKNYNVTVNSNELKYPYELQHRYFIHTNARLTQQHFDDAGIRGNLAENREIYQVFRNSDPRYNSVWNWYSKVLKDSSSSLGYICFGRKSDMAKLKARMKGDIKGVHLGLILPEGNQTMEAPFWGGDRYSHWNIDNMGPFVVPRKGMKIKMTPSNCILYEHVITYLDGNNVDDVLFTYKYEELKIKGEPQEYYTFKKDYYFMMGDNRHNSQDSRIWGFVPEDHIVGKAVMIWFSYQPGDGIRWNRIFNMVK